MFRAFSECYCCISAVHYKIHTLCNQYINISYKINPPNSSNEEVKFPFQYCKSMFLSRLIMTSILKQMFFVSSLYRKIRWSFRNCKSSRKFSLLKQTENQFIRKHYIFQICFCVFEMWLLTCLALNVTGNFSEKCLSCQILLL